MLLAGLAYALMSVSANSKISIVISVFNEAEGLTHFWSDLKSELLQISNHSFEIIWVNDGSADSSQSTINLLLQDSADRITHQSIEFSKNFGHEAAMIAGIDHAKGDAIICLDADLQHPPSKIAELLERYKGGADIVLTERTSRGDNGAFKRVLSKVFYKTINWMSTFRFQENSTDFFLISRKVSRVLRSNFRERNRFIRGFIQTIGFNKSVVHYEAPAREHGTTSYSYRGLLRLAFNAIFAFSNKPLRLSLTVTLIFILMTIILGTYSLGVYFFGEDPPSGYTTIILFLSVSFTILFFLLTILFLYFEKALEEMRQRPIYIIKEKKVSGEEQDQLATV